MKMLINLLLSLIDAFEIRTTDLVLATMKRIQRGIIVSFLVMILALLWTIATTPENIKPPATSPQVLAYTIHQYLHLGGTIVLIGASVSALFLIVRYFLVAKWPERFVDFSQQRHS